MNILCDTYVFYADIYFLQNFLIKVAVLYLSLFCNKLHLSITTVGGIGRVLLASFLGTGMEIIGLLVGNSYHIFLLLVHILELPLMMFVVLGKRRKQFFKVIISGYFFVMVINGVLEVLWNCFGEKGNYVFFLCEACLIVYAGLRIRKNYKKIQKGIFPVEIRHGDKQMTLYGFYDSGNSLKDPYTRKGVQILSECMLSQLPLDGQKEVYIPYEALGNRQGLIKVYYLEYIRIQKEQKCLELEMVPVGIAEGTLFQNKKYQMILNEEVW